MIHVKYRHRILKMMIKQSVYLAAYLPIVHLPKRFHAVVRLVSNRSEMTSKCGKNKKSGKRGESQVCH